MNQERLTDKHYILDILGLSRFELTEIIKKLPDEEYKKKCLEIYDDILYDTLKLRIIRTLSSSSKLKIIFDYNYIKKEFTKYAIVDDLLASLDPEDLCYIFSQHREYLEKLNIYPYEIMFHLNTESQNYFIANIEKTKLSLNEKREILASLDDEVKQNVNLEAFPEEYKTALKMHINKKKYAHEFLEVDLDKNIEDYYGLRIPMKIIPEELTEEQTIIFKRLCRSCPNIKVISPIPTVPLEIEIYSTSDEYIEAEQWIDSLIDNLNPQYSNLQKIAVIDNAIGKKVSYSPNLKKNDEEEEDYINPRALWKIISCGYGTCEGIANLERYILKRVGIASELVSGHAHAFLILKDISLISEDGKEVIGDTILDPTWNLSAHRFGAKPNTFCISYKEARKQDINENGEDHYCHRKSGLENITLELDENNLRNLFASVGIADNDGIFPIKQFIEKSKELDKIYADDTEKNFKKQLELFSISFPDFATCQISSIKILSDIFSNTENLKFDQCIINIVYNREDKNKEPVLYLCIDSSTFGRKFYYADKSKKQFIEASLEEFTKQFECYESDIFYSGRIKTLGN